MLWVSSRSGDYRDRRKYDFKDDRAIVMAITLSAMIRHKGDYKRGLRKLLNELLLRFKNTVEVIAVSRVGILTAEIARDEAFLK